MVSSRLPKIVSFGAAATLVVLAAVGATASSQASNDPHATVRGMTISCHRAGQVWGTDATARSMTQLADLGVNWVAIHPYAGIRADGEVVIWEDLYDEQTWLRRPIDEAHRRGLKIAIKPHIAYWGSPFSWRGEITFETDRQWRRFFDSYREWVTYLANVCQDADAFFVGTELDQTIQYEHEWTRIISAVRAETDAPLTYSANWDRFEHVPFWHALDAISIQAYFPLVDHSHPPTDRELEHAWDRLMDRLESFGRGHRRDIVFGELGYNRSALAAVRPWDARTGGQDADGIQRRCFNAALHAIKHSDVVVGAFLWKWFPVGDGRGNFLMTTSGMRQLIAEHWSERSCPAEAVP
jgi:hypothetical protein